MRASEIYEEKSGWETVRPKITRALGAMSKKLGADFCSK